MISFELTDEQKMLVETAGRFARDRMRPSAREIDETASMPMDLLTTAWQLGFIPASIPEAYGGFGGRRSAVTGALFAEELAYGDLAVALAVLAPGLTAFPLLTSGDENQRRDLLPRFSTEEFPWATAALLEPCYQFDPLHLATKARRDGDCYLLSGKKCCVPLAPDAEVTLVYAEEETGGVQGFLLEKGAPGLIVGEREGYMGIRGLPTHGLVLEECRVAATRRLGGDQGCDYGRLLNYSRVALAAMAVGVARAAAEFARDYAKQRKQFGEPIASRQAIAFMLADMAIETDASRLMAWDAAWKLDRDEEATREAYLAKLYADDMVLRVTDGAVQTLGGYGYIREFPVEMWLRNGRGFATFDGLATV